MRASAIHNLAITDESSIVAAGLFQKTVQIWSWKTGQQLGEFQTMLDSGGKRLALAPDGSACIVGAWGQPGRGARGLAAYSIPEGRLIWNRKDIRRIQTVRMSGSGREIYCGVQDSSAHIVDAASGELIERVRRAQKIVGSRYTSHQLIVQESRCLIRGGSKFEISPTSGLLDAALSPDALCLSEPRDGSRPAEHQRVHLIDLATGEKRSGLDLHAPRLAYNSEDQRFYCVSRLLVEPHTWSLIRLGSGVLKSDKVCDLVGSWEHAFTPSGRALVTSTGDVYETSTGVLLSHLDFPQRDYPDR